MRPSSPQSVVLKKEIVTPVFIFWTAALLLFFVYRDWGLSLIEDMYYERSVSFLNEMLEGRNRNSLADYHTQADGFAYTFIAGLVLIPFLYPLMVLWAKGGGPDHVRSLRVLIVSFPILFVAMLIYMKIELLDHYQQFFMTEDQVVEYLTSAVYFAAFCVSLAIAIRFLRTRHTIYAIMYFSLSGGLMFISMEEISWGQRLIGIETPEVFVEHNYQGEMNIHNFLGRYPLHFLYIVVGFYGTYSRILVPKRLIEHYPVFVDLVTPNRYLALYFFPTFALYIYVDYLSSWAVRWFGPHMGAGPRAEGYFVWPKDQEPVELLLGLGFLLFVAINLYRQLHLPAEWVSKSGPRSTENV